MIKLLFTFCIALSSLNVFAQMALPSVFPEMKTVNPAVISLRKSGNIRGTAQVDKIDKVQHIKYLDSNPFVVEETGKIDLTNANFFRGGKGGGFTTELSADYTTGKKVSTLVDNSNSTSTYTQNATSNYINLSIGTPGKFGLGLLHVDYKSNYTFNSTVNGSSYNDSNSSKVTVMGAKPGVVFGNQNLSLGLTAEYDKLTTSGSTGAPQAQQIIGMAIATGGSNALLELGVEFDPFAKTTNPMTNEKLPMPTKFSFLAETRIGGLTIGYKGMAFKGSYIDLDRVIQSQLVFGDIGNDMRLEHIFNFSLGGTSGISFGGSASYSKTNTKEKSSIFFSSNKHDTETKAMSASLKLGYSY